MRRLVLHLCVALSGCSLLVQFDPETQPCDSAGLCSVGYVCRDGGCHSLDAGVRDGGCLAREEQCTDGVDDDCDGAKDCADSDCSGKSCDDRDPCTEGDTCGSGECRPGGQKSCANPGPCQRAGTCEPTTGTCIFPSAPDGTSCGSVPAARCCSGACVSTTSNTTHCGGCGLTCGTGQLCQSINQSACGLEPTDASGRCSCGGSAPCPKGQRCESGYCVPASAAQCASGQSLASVAGCSAYCAY